jgi:hypothetical protein
VDFECSVLSVTVPCDGAVTRQEEFYGLWCVCVIEEPHRGGPGPQGLPGHEKKVSKDRPALYIRSDGATLHGTQYTHHNLQHMLPQHCKTYNDAFLLINPTKM